MATTLFFRYANADGPGGSGNPTPGVHTSFTQTSLAGTTDPYSPMGLTTTRGNQTTGVSLSQNTVTGPTNGVELRDSLVSGGNGEWISPPLAAGVTISGTITALLWSAESSMSANVAINVVVDRMGPDGTITQIAKSARVTENPTARAPQSFTVTPTSTAFAKGDRIRVRIFGDDAGTMASGFTFDVSMGRNTASVDGDSSIQFTETLTFQTSQPTGDKLYLTSAAGPAVGAQVEKEMWTSRGAGSTTAVTNSATGPTAGVQITDSAGGSAIEWYSRPLTAFTLADVVMVSLTSMFVGNQSLGVGVRFELAITDSAGGSPTVWASQAIVDSDAPGGTWSASAGATTQQGGIISATGGTLEGYLTGPDTAITDGQRLRLRIYLDDTSDGTMQSGTVATLQYNGPTAGAAGDSFIRLSQSGITEFVSGTAGLTKIGVKLTAGGALAAPSAAANLEAGVIAKAGALAEFSRSSVSVVGVVTPTGATRDYSSSAFGAIGLISRSQGALFEPTVTNGRSITGIAPLAGGAIPAPNAVTLAAVGLLTRAGAARPEPNSSSNLEVGVLTVAGTARPDALAAALAELGVILRAIPSTTDVVSNAYAALGACLKAGTARPDITAAGNLEVGALALAGTGRPEPSSSSRTVAGIILLSGTSRPDALAAALTELGVITVAGTSRPEPSAAARALVGIVSTSMPSVVGDLTVSGLVVLGIATRSSGNTVDIPSSARALLGAVPRSGGALFEPGLSIGRAFVGAVLLGGGALPAVSSSSIALAGVVARAGGATPNMIATAAAIAGAVTRGIPVVTVTAAAAARLGLITRSVPTVTFTSSGRVVVGIVTYAEAVVGGQLVVVLPKEWARYREPAPTVYAEAGPSRYREPRPSTFGEPPATRWRDNSPVGG